MGRARLRGIELEVGDRKFSDDHQPPGVPHDEPGTPRQAGWLEEQCGQLLGESLPLDCAETRRDAEVQLGGRGGLGQGGGQQPEGEQVKGGSLHGVDLEKSGLLVIENEILSQAGCGVAVPGLHAHGQ